MCTLNSAKPPNESNSKTVQVGKKKDAPQQYHWSTSQTCVCSRCGSGSGWGVQATPQTRGAHPTSGHSAENAPKKMGRFLAGQQDLHVSRGSPDADADLGAGGSCKRLLQTRGAYPASGDRDPATGFVLVASASRMTCEEWKRSPQERKRKRLRICSRRGQQHGAATCELVCKLSNDKWICSTDCYLLCAGSTPRTSSVILGFNVHQALQYFKIGLVLIFLQRPNIFFMHLGIVGGARDGAAETGKKHRAPPPTEEDVVIQGPSSLLPPSFKATITLVSFLTSTPVHSPSKSPAKSPTKTAPTPFGASTPPGFVRRRSMPSEVDVQAAAKQDKGNIPMDVDAEGYTLLYKDLMVTRDSPSAESIARPARARIRIGVRGAHDVGKSRPPRQRPPHFFWRVLHNTTAGPLERLAQLLQFCEGGKCMVELCTCRVRHHEYFEVDSIGGFAKFSARMMLVVASMEEG
ncbi:hypothetical protein B0H14DRAFT_2593409 [Mycena olivaceomarginata]|nr:hypothetical protein B0H14DRAFT_2593409 [Mycena olivaceomarginata]